MQSRPGRIPTLDGWRGIAILLVLVDHFQITTDGSEGWFYYLGQQGVAIFFVLSGFLITSNLLREREHSGTIALKQFYARRFLRLAPVAICYLIVAGLLGVHVREIIACLLFCRNLGPRGTVLTGHFWSLSLEEQFYLVWPLLLLTLRPRRALIVALCGAMAIAAWRHHKTPAFMHSYWWGTVRTQYRADALLLGCALAILMRSARARDLLRRFPLFPALVVLAACCCHFRMEVPFGESALIALIIGATALLPAEHSIRRGLEWKPLGWLGLVSYSIYVWQQLPTQLFAHSGTYFAARLLICVALVLASYYGIERPMQRLRRRLRVDATAASPSPALVAD